MAGYVAFVAYMMKANEDKNDNEDSKAVYNGTKFVGMYYLLLTFIGFSPPLIIKGFTGRWTAPPFYYPENSARVLNSHVLPAICWLLLSTVQVFLISQAYYMGHRVLGNPIIFTNMVIFLITAVYSEVKKVSPLGDFVICMESALAIGVFVTFCTGMYFIAAASQNYFGDAEFEKNRVVLIQHHKEFMILTIFYAGGPGLFRVLRTTREFLTCRLFQASRYSAYSDVPNTPYLKSFRDVEATYFSMAFVITTSMAAYVLHLMDGLYWMTILYLTFPFLAILLFVSLRCSPSLLNWLKLDHQDMNWSFALDYNFDPLLKPGETSIYPKGNENTNLPMDNYKGYTSVGTRD
jgi:hypothetical protein